MAFGDILRVENQPSFYSSTLTLTSPVAVGNTIVVVSDTGAATVSDDVNGAYTTALAVTPAAGNGDGVSIHFVISTSAASAPTITVSSGGARMRALEVEGSLAFANVSSSNSGVCTTGSAVVFQTASGTLPTNSVSLGVFDANAPGTGVLFDSPWSAVGTTCNTNMLALATRADATATSDNFSGTYSGLDSSYTFSTGFVSFTEVNNTPTLRKGSEFIADKTIGTVTTATLNGVNVFDHLTAQDATTATFAGAITDEITTSGEYTLVLGDGTTTENITVQVNVVGILSHTFTKDGAGLASLSDVEIIVHNSSGSEIVPQRVTTTDVNAAIPKQDFSSVSEAVGDTVKVSVYSPSAQVGITYEQALELI